MASLSTFHAVCEARRLRAYELAKLGWAQTRIAEALGVTDGAVSQWLKAARTGGPDALAAHPAPGAQPRLTADQLAAVPALLRQGAEAHGFAGDVWTSVRVADLLERTFGVRFHPSHVRRLLHQLGWSRQQPIRRATQRDDAAIATWAEERYPALKKMPKRGADPPVCR